MAASPPRCGYTAAAPEATNEIGTVDHGRPAPGRTRHGISRPRPVRPANRNQRTIYVTALDRDGRPVTDLQAADFAIKVGNKTLDVIRAEPAQMPLRIAVLVSDAGTGGFQQGLGEFMQKLLGHAEFR